MNNPRPVAGTSSKPRKTNANTENWKRSVQKRLRTQGKQYIKKSGKLIPAMKVQASTCGKACHFNCNTYFNGATKKQIHDYFWTLSDEEKNIFIRNMLTYDPQNVEE